jgi:hypothetical protein
MLRALMASALAAAVVTAQNPPSPHLVPLYFPTKVGDKRVYELRAGDKTLQAVETVTKVESKATCFLVTVERSSVKGEATDAYEVSPRGVVHVETGGKKLRVPYQHLKLPAKAGDTWTMPKIGLGADQVGTLYTAGKEVEVEVPAGKFKTIPVVSKTTGPGGGSTTVTSWYATNVGLVKMEAMLPDIEVTQVLKSFTPGK